MSTLIILRGLPASGKSTWATSYVRSTLADSVVVSRDALRVTLFQSEEKGPLSRQEESQITDVQEHMAKRFLRKGYDVIVDDMNLRPKYVKRWIALAQEQGVEWNVTPFPISLVEAIKRDKAREDWVGSEVIRRLAEKYLRAGDFMPFEVPEQGVPARYVPRPGSPRAILVDIDGTVAKNLGGRGWYDYDRVGEDSPNKPIVDLVNAVSLDYEVIFLSGRKDDCRAVTSEWLEKHFGPVFEPDQLFMRATGDNRKDAIVKRELFDENVRNFFDVQFCLDDRDQVVQMWRDELGLTCLQVDWGNF